MADEFIPHRPVIVAYSKMPEAFAEAEQVAGFLKKKGFEAPQGSIYDEDLRRRVKAGDFDVLIALGGDGTMLRAGHLCAPFGVPILGIMMGRLGFLMQVQRNEWPHMLERLLQG
jgi:NAD+ kinase